MSTFSRRVNRNLFHQRPYLPAIVALALAGKIPLAPGTLTRVTVAHDDDCLIWTEGRCTCEPEIRALRKPVQGKGAA